MIDKLNRTTVQIRIKDVADVSQEKDKTLDAKSLQLEIRETFQPEKR